MSDEQRSSHSQPQPADAVAEERLYELIAAYLEAVREGHAPDRGQLLREHPELAADLESFFAEHDRMQQLIAPPTLLAPAAVPAERVRAATPHPADVVTVGVDRAGAGTTTGPPSVPLRRFGDYELLELIARGGMGAVYKARQISLNRIVAVKVILAGELATAEEIARFQSEAAMAANLQHHNIVKIFGVGEHDGQHYFAMEYVAGKNLLQLLRERPVAPKQAARYVQQIAQAIDYAHQHGVLHRDIKPSNVLIDAGDQVRVMDFGLAKWVEADHGLTASCQILGTASYMAPEQAAGKRAQIGAASDVFSLGAVLYELLTGRPPFQGRNHLETLLLVRDVDPELPQRINPQVPRELAMICLKCLEKDPQHRYPSAQALADDLTRYLNGDSISIASLGLFERLSREFERSHHDVELSTWGDMTLWVAGLTFVTHAVIGLLVRLKVPSLWSLMGLARGVEFLGIAGVLWAHWRHWYPPRGTPARQCWAIWFSYLAGSVVLAAASWLQASPTRPVDPLALYPQYAVLASIGFFVLGSSYWGYCYVFGFSFLVLAVVMSLALPWAPLLFGISMGACFTLLGRHLRDLGRTQ